MNWSSSDFPPLVPQTPPGLDSQVMSPTAIGAGFSGWEESVFTAGAATPSASRDAATRFPWEAAGGAAAAGGHKNRIMLRPLDTGRAEDYDSWRHSAAAEVVANAADPGRAVGYMSAIDQPLLYPSEGLLNAVQQDEALRALDAQLYGAILTCLQGPMRGAVEGRIRAQGQAYAGCLALRLLDAWFHNSVSKRRAGATRELITLNPRGKGAAAMEEFFSRYRLLLQQAGRANVGPDAQIDILQRAAEDHPRLCSVWAAWEEAGGRDHDKLQITRE